MADQSNPTTVELTAENQDSILSKDGIVLVKCWASHCGGCKMLDPIYAKLHGEYPDHTFAKLDTLAEKELSSNLSISHVPTILLYRDGLQLFHEAGNFDEDQLKDVITQAEGLDMEVVRAHFEAEAKNSAE